MKNNAKHIYKRRVNRHGIRMIMLCVVVVALVITAVVVILFTTVFKPHANSLQQQDDGPLTIRIGQSEYDYPPLHYYENGELVGFDVDLAKAAAEIMGAEIEFVPINWSDATEMLASGEVDLLWGGLERASLDEHIVHFTKSYLRSNIVLLMPEDRDYSVWEDLQGLNVCALNFTPAFNYLQAYSRDVIKSKRSYTPTEYQMLLTSLSSGEFDCMITDTSFAAYFLMQNTDETFKMSDTVLGSNYAVGVRIDDTGLFELIQNTLDELQANGTIDRLREIWIGD